MNITYHQKIIFIDLLKLHKKNFSYSNFLGGISETHQHFPPHKSILIILSVRICVKNLCYILRIYFHILRLYTQVLITRCFETPPFVWHHIEIFSFVLLINWKNNATNINEKNDNDTVPIHIMPHARYCGVVLLNLKVYILYNNIIM